MRFMVFEHIFPVLFIHIHISLHAFSFIHSLTHSLSHSYTPPVHHYHSLLFSFFHSILILIHSHIHILNIYMCVCVHGLGLAYFPAVSLNLSERCEINFGLRPFEYPIEIEGYKPLDITPNLYVRFGYIISNAHSTTHAHAHAHTYMHSLSLSLSLSLSFSHPLTYQI